MKLISYTTGIGPTIIPKVIQKLDQLLTLEHLKTKDPTLFELHSTKKFHLQHQ